MQLGMKHDVLGHATRNARRYLFSTLACLMVASVAVPSLGQLTADVTVDVEQETDGLYTYNYTIETSFLSSLGVDWFQLDVANGPTVVEGVDQDFFVRALELPDDWAGTYEPYRTELDENFEIIGLQLEGGTGLPRANDFEVAIIAGDGLICDHPSGGVAPGTSTTFTLRSRYAPEERDFLIAKTNSFCEFVGDGRGTILAPSIPPVVEGLACDFDGDGDCDLVDVNAMGNAVAGGSAELQFDLNLDGAINQLDLDLFLASDDVLKVNGDANFDGEVGFVDFLTLSGNFGAPEAKWSDGDFIPDGQVGFADFLLLSGNFGRTSAGLSSGALANVPEPSSTSLLAFALMSCAIVRRRARSATS